MVKKSGLIFSAIVLLFASSTAFADTLWSNGAVSGNTGRCDWNSPNCGSTGWTVYDDFKLSSNSTITGFTYNDYLAWGSWNDYTGTNWTLYYNQSAPWSGTPIASGTMAGTLTPGDSGSELVSLLGLNIGAAPGYYILGFQNNFSGDTATTRAGAAGNGLIGYFQQDNLGTYHFDLAGDTAFSVLGSAATPEPSSLLMLGSGLAGLAAALRRKLVA